MPPELAHEPTEVGALDADAFAERYGCDRLTATVLVSKYRYVVQHMCSGLLTTAFSIILRDWYDFAATVSGPRSLGYPVPAVSNSLVVFSGSMDQAVANSVEEWGPGRLRPGDVLICNDPYRTGTHVNDICFIRPVFHPGAEEPVGFISMEAHMMDMGGVVPAGFSGTKLNVYEEGLVISPRLLYRDDEPVPETWNMIFDNARFGELLLVDVQSIVNNLRLGERLLGETIERYGLDAYLGAMRYACDLSAQSIAAAIASVPDGVYEAEELIDCDGLDDAEEYRIAVRATVAGDRMEVDLSGTARQARTSINAGWLDAKTAIGIGVKFLLDPTAPLTSALYRNIDVVLPQGTVVSALPKDGAIHLYTEPQAALMLAVMKALAPALGERAIGGDFCSLNIHQADGVHPDGTPWITMAQCGGEHGPWGATAEADADSFSVFYLANNLDPATEAIEADVPAVILRKEYATDTAGAGWNRGGAAVVKDTLYTAPANHRSMPLHYKRPSGFGVNGGADGATGAVWVWPDGRARVGERGRLVEVAADDAYADADVVAGRVDPRSGRPAADGDYAYFARVPVRSVQAQTLFRYLTNGGGGWGDPFARDPQRVLRDVRDEYVSPAAAARDYGVAIVGDPVADPEGLRVDEAATAALRAARTGAEVRR